MNISFAFLRMLAGIIFKSGKKSFFFTRGIIWTFPPAKRVATGYTGYPGEGTSTTSPGFINASGICPIPSLEPIRERTSDWGFKETLNLFLYQSEVLSLIGSKEGIGHIPLAFKSW